MADISAITALDGVTYSIKDSEAREHLVPSTGTTGQVLTKTASGYEWDDATGGGNVDTVNDIQPDANKNVETMVSLTAAQYDQIPDSVKNFDNKLYLVEDEAYTYPIDSAPTQNSDHLVASGGVYTAVANANARIDDCADDIATNTADISTLKTGLTSVNSALSKRPTMEYWKIVNGGTSVTYNNLLSGIVTVFFLQYGNAGLIITAFTDGATVTGEYKGDVTATVSSGTLTINNTSARNYRITILKI